MTSERIPYWPTPSRSRSCKSSFGDAAPYAEPCEPTLRGHANVPTHLCCVGVDLRASPVTKSATFKARPATAIGIEHVKTPIAETPRPTHRNAETPLSTAASRGRSIGPSAIHQAYQVGFGCAMNFTSSTIAASVGIAAASKSKNCFELASVWTN